MADVHEIILAAGNQDRFGSGHIKQLLPVNGVPLIVDIQNKFPGAVVVTRDQEIIKHSKRYFEPGAYRWTCETLGSTYSLWNGAVSVLLGDVYYSDDCVKQINSFDGEIMFWGNKHEIFALKFECHDDIYWAIQDLIIMASEQKNGSPLDCRLWHLYRLYNNYSRHKHFIGDNFTYIEDETQDFDYIDQYEIWCNNH